MTMQKDPFLDPFWNLDQICAWGRARDCEVVQFAALMKHDSGGIAVRSAHAAARSKQAGRDVNLELWRASGWKMPENDYTAPMAVERVARELGVPVFWILNDASMEVHVPRCEQAEALLAACANAGHADRDLLLKILAAGPEHEHEWLDAPEAVLLPVGLRQRLAAYVNRKEVQGPWRLLRRPPFPIEDYLLQLQLTAYANLPTDPVARILTKADWGGLEIAVGGDLRRLCAWRIGRVANVGRGDFENVRVEREAVLAEFPLEPTPIQTAPIPATDEEARALIREALNDSSGYLSQEKGAEIVRAKIPGFLKKRAMQLVKELTGNDKPGPKGPWKNRAANRAG
ncbi:MAG: hypothetical protein JO288_10400 [Hyphomicrobiales bacterium]|nr:hypothetical protein [Hyphomicrobiales bacterium]